jgi:hypothetical protein
MADGRRLMTASREHAGSGLSVFLRLLSNTAL